MTPDQLNAALRPFGAEANAQGFIVKGGKTLSVRAITRNGRLRFESSEGALLASGRPDAAFVAHFVGRFWFWKSEVTK